MKLVIRDVLNEYNIKYEENEGKYKLLCPFHSDNTPSGILSQDGKYYCFGCNISTNLYSLLRRKLGKNVFFEINTKFGEFTDKYIQTETIEEAHAHLVRESAKQFREALYRRQVTNDDINDYRFGLLKDRISIPIRNEAGFFVNIRLYKPGDVHKFLNFQKFGTPIRLFPIEQIQYDKIMLCGGELKALVAAKELNQHDIGAISTTGGENKFPTHLQSYFSNKIVYICLDIDDVGRQAAQLWANAMRAAGAKWISIIDLPLDREKYPKGDINDYLSIEGNILLPLIEQSLEWTFKPQKELYLELEDPMCSTLTSAMHANLASKRIKLKAVVSTMDVSPYPIPSEVEVLCDRSEKFCDQCTISGYPPDKQITRISSENPALLQMIGESKKAFHDACKSAVGIPLRCRKCDFKILNYYNIEEAKLSEPFSLQSKMIERSMQSAFCVGKALELNTNYEMIGRMFPHPKTQQATLLISDYKPTDDALSNYVCENIEKLRIFNPKEWTKESLEEKLKDIYTDLEANVTHIYKRHDLHLVCDLAYHSPLFLPIEGKEEKGWIEVLIVGDSGQGKSWVAQNLMNYYNLGEKIDCPNATKSGLIGGSENFGKRWFVTWGKIPLNDRGLVLLEELKGMKPEIFAKCLEMRSSGIAQIDSIVRRTTYARTRMIVNSNPRSDRPVSSYNYGTDCLLELIGNREGLRRFEICLIVDRTEVNAGELEAYRPKVENKYTRELCRELVLWSWTLDTQQIIFEDWDYLLKSLRVLYEKFSDIIPIVDTGSMRLKLSRLAAALACRTFSVNDFGLLYIRNCHVDFMISFLDKIYSKPSCGYAQFSDTILKSEKITNLDGIRVKINTLKFPKEFVESMLSVEEINVFFLQDLLAIMPEDARELLSFLLRNRCIKRENTGYRKTQDFTLLLKSMQTNGELKEDTRPNFLKNEFE